MPTILDELITKVRWDVDTSGLNEADNKASSFRSKMVGVLGALGAVVGGGAFISAATAAADESLKMADAMGIAVEELQVMEGVASKVGVNVDTLRGHMFNLNAQIAEAQRGGGPLVEEFEHFGIAVKDATGKALPISDVMTDIRNKIQDLDSAQRVDFVDKLGFDEETIGFLDLAPDQFAKLSAEIRGYGVVTREQAQASRDFLRSINNIGKSFQVLTLTVANFGGSFITDFINTLARGVAALANNERALKLIGISLVAVGAATASAWIPAAAAVLTAVAPFVALGAAVSAVILVVEDLWAYFQGAPSLIGDMAKEFPILQTVLDGLESAFAAAGKTIEAIFGRIKYNIDVTWKFIKVVGDFIIDLFNQIANLDFKKLIGDAVESVSGFTENLNPLNWFSDDNEDDEVVAQRTQSVVNMITSEKIETAAAVPPAGASADAAAIMGGSPVTNNSDNSVKIEKVEVNAQGGDSREIAANVGGAIRDQLRNTVQDTDSRVKR